MSVRCSVFIATGLDGDIARVTAIAVLLGSGRRLFGDLSQDRRFDLAYSRSYPNGLVQSRYVARDAA